MTLGKTEPVKAEPVVKGDTKEPVPIEKLVVDQVPSMTNTFDPVTGKLELVLAVHLNPAVAKELVDIESSKVEFRCDDAGVTVIRVTIDAMTAEERAEEDTRKAKEAADKAKAEGDADAKAKAKADAATAKEAAQDEKDARADEKAKAKASRW